jgi:dihydropteroate synthase
MQGGSGASGPASRFWRAGRFGLDLAVPRVMGIVNATPDSFSDGGLHTGAAAAIAHCERQIQQGADILDIGGESTRPGAVAPSADEELARVLPVLRHAVTLGVPVSVDTSEPRVMQAALDIGADIVNDVRALRREGALACVAAHPSAGLCLMHMRGEPADMAGHTDYGDVVAEVAQWLQHRLAEVSAAGIAPERIVLDPGIGFGKAHEHNLALVRGLGSIVALGRPVLMGLSRKSLLGRLLGEGAPIRGSDPASAGAAVFALLQGATLFRVHDVRAHLDALTVAARLADGPAAPGPGASASVAP